MKKSSEGKRLLGKHNEPTRYVCRRYGCEASFSTAGNRGRHEKSNCGVAGDIIVAKKCGRKCDGCNRVFAREYCLKRHLRYSCRKLKSPVLHTVVSGHQPDFSDDDADDENRCTLPLVGTVEGSPEPKGVEVLLDKVLNTVPHVRKLIL